MKNIVKKWGNSLAIRIPKSFAEEIGLKNESSVELSLSDKKLIIKPLQEYYSLESLVRGINKRNKQEEKDYGKRTGAEVW
jgi:antitoxin MazE